MKYLETIANFIGTPGLIALLVCFIGPPIAYYFNIKVNKTKLVHQNFNEFEKIFTPTLHLLDDPKQTSYIIVDDEFPKHEAAMLDFEHNLEGICKDRFKAKWTKYLNKCEKIRQYGYNICPVEKGGPPTIGILEHIRDRQNNLIEIEPDRAYKEKLKKLINELLEIAKH